ncbi:unnamed protein product [Prunus armeniaca]
MINPPDHSCNVTYFINNQPQQYMNYSVVLQIVPAAASNWTRSYSNNSNHHHEIFAFVIPTLLTLVQMRYPAVDLFQTHPTAPWRSFIGILVPHGHACVWFTLGCFTLVASVSSTLLLLPNFVRLVVVASGGAELEPLGKSEAVAAHQPRITSGTKSH